MDRQRAQRHRDIASAARGRLEKLHIKSTNKFWQNSNRVGRGLDTNRFVFGYTNAPGHDVGLEQGAWSGLEDDEFVADVTFTLGAGNCDEKASVFGVLCSRDGRIGDSRIYRCSFDPYDHVVALLTARADLVEGTTGMKLADFGPEAVVLDGWAEDWWFPNVSTRAKLRDGLWRTCSAFARIVRSNSRGCNNLKIVSRVV